MFCVVPNATVHTTMNNVLIKTLLNNAGSALCGPLCPVVSLQASWQQHSGTISNPMLMVHIECSNCPLSIGQENILAMELIARCAQVRNSCVTPLTFSGSYLLTVL